MATTAFATGAYRAIQNLDAARAGGSGAAGGGPAGLGATGAKGTDFGSVLAGVLEGVAQSGHKAEAMASAAAGGRTDLVNVVTAVAESETALQTLVAVRDRVISAYEEIMRMQI